MFFEKTKNNLTLEFPLLWRRRKLQNEILMKIILLTN